MADRVLTPQRIENLRDPVIFHNEVTSDDWRELADLCQRLRAERDLLRAEVALDAPALLEVLAEAEHARWSGWMRYQETAPQERRADWPRKAATSYWGLTDAERESDRIEARKTLEIVRNYLRAAVDAFDKEKTLKAALAEGAEP